MQRLSAELRPGNALPSSCHTIKEQLENAAFNKFLVKDQLKFFLWKISEQAQSPTPWFQGDRQRAPHVVMATGLHNKSNFLKHHVQDVKLWRCSHFRSHILDYAFLCWVRWRGGFRFQRRLSSISTQRGCLPGCCNCVLFIQPSFSCKDCWGVTRLQARIMGTPLSWQ